MEQNSHRTSLILFAVVSLISTIFLIIKLITAILYPSDEMNGLVRHFLFWRIRNADAKPVIALALLVVAVNTFLWIAARYSKGGPKRMDIPAAAAITSGIILFLVSFPPMSVDGTTCSSNLKQLGTAINMYYQNYDHHYPPLDKWNGAILPFTKNSKIFYCRRAISRDIPSYAMNKLLKDLSFDDVAMPDKTVLLFESVPGKNLSGGSELFPSPPRHDTYDGETSIPAYGVLFVDGHVEMVYKSEIGKLIWNPRSKP